MASSESTEYLQGKTCTSGEGDSKPTRPPDNPDKQLTNQNSQVFKCGPLFISSKGIGWTSWKKRWFVLTRSSLVFYRSDPNAQQQKGSEANLTLGGIDLNNSGSVVVKADKKLLTVLFPDGRDGRAFTLKAETLEDLNEWKTALENALAQAPSASLAMGQGIFQNDLSDSIEASSEQHIAKEDKENKEDKEDKEDKQLVNSAVVGRPILLALEEIDGSPSFLEKALRFIEEYGIKVEGILRQSADVEEVKRRVQEYEQGKNEFSSDEDAHVIGDCIKYVLRELPSSPVPASCCTALVEAYRTDRGDRIDAMHAAVYETFPEPNRHLLQRMLKMMLTVASHKSENRMSLSALAACMAPLLLRPLLAGDCEFEDDFNMGGDGSIQLLKAAAAANHAQAIVIIFLEEYETIFDEDLFEDGSFSSELYSESEDGDVEDYESTDHDIREDDGYHDAHNDLDADIDETDQSYSGTLSACSHDVDSDLSDDEPAGDHNSDGTYSEDYEVNVASRAVKNTVPNSSLQMNTSQELSTSHVPVQDNVDAKKKTFHREDKSSFVERSHETHESFTDFPYPTSPTLKAVGHSMPSSIGKFVDKSNEPMPTAKRRTIWGRTSARKNLSMESIDMSSDEEVSIQRLETTRNDLQTKVAKEVKGNAALQASLARRKEALRERRLALEEDVERLREQLQKERDLRVSLESGLMNLRPGHVSYSSSMDNQAKAELEEIALAEADIINLKQKVADLRGQLNHQLQQNYPLLCDVCSKRLYSRDQSAKYSKDQHGDVNVTSSLQQKDDSLKSDYVSSGLAWKSAQAKAENSPSSPNAEPSFQSRTRSSCTTGSSNIEPSTIGTFGPSTRISLKDEADHVDMKAQTWDSPSSPGLQPLEMQQVDTMNENSSRSPSSNSFPCTEQLATTISYTGSTMSNSVDENSLRASDCVNVKNQTQDSLPSSDRQHSKKQQVYSTNMSSTRFLSSASFPSAEPYHKEEPNATGLSNSKSLGSANLPAAEEPHTVGHHTASKKPSKGENIKKEMQDPPSLPKQPSQKQYPNNISVNSFRSQGSNSLSSSEEFTTVGRNASSKMFSPRAEETASSSTSTLTKLTSRLNFLKERRTQLGNEIQNLDSDCSSGLEAPPRNR